MSWLAGVFTRAGGTDRIQQESAAPDPANSVEMDNDLNDLADGVNQCLNKDGSNAMTNNLDFGGFVPANMGGVTTFSPTFGGFTAGTYTDQIGQHIKIGALNIVTILLTTTIVTGGGSGTLSIQGLPEAPDFDVPVCIGELQAPISGPYGHDNGDMVSAVWNDAQTQFNILINGANAVPPPNGDLIRIYCQAIYSKV